MSVSGIREEWDVSFFVDGGIQFEADVWGIEAVGGDVCIDDKKREKTLENNK